MPDLGATAMTAIGGALLADRRDRAGDTRARRRAAGDRLYTALLQLRQLAYRRDLELAATDWIPRILEVYAALDECRFTLPRGWGHLKRSMRFAIGESTRLAFVDIAPRSAEETAVCNPTWMGFAADYLDYTLSCLGRWREPFSNRRADAVTLMDFDTWLRKTDRFTWGAGIYPSDRK